MGNQPFADSPQTATFDSVSAVSSPDSLVIDYETRLLSLLFGERLSEYELAKRIEAGLPVSVVGVLRTEGLTDIEINTAVNRHTFDEHVLREQRTLKREESEGVLRLVAVLALAQQTFDNREKAVAWLRRNNKNAHGHTPIQLLRSPEGAERVQEMLYQIDEGIYS